MWRQIPLANRISLPCSEPKGPLLLWLFGPSEVLLWICCFKKENNQHFLLEKSKRDIFTLFAIGRICLLCSQQLVIVPTLAASLALDLSSNRTRWQRRSRTLRKSRKTTRLRMAMASNSMNSSTTPLSFFSRWPATCVSGSLILRSTNRDMSLVLAHVAVHRKCQYLVHIGAAAQQQQWGSNFEGSSVNSLGSPGRCRLMPMNPANATYNFLKTLHLGEVIWHTYNGKATTICNIHWIHPENTKAPDSPWKEGEGVIGKSRSMSDIYIQNSSRETQLVDCQYPRPQIEKKKTTVSHWNLSKRGIAIQPNQKITSEGFNLEKPFVKGFWRHIQSIQCSVDSLIHVWIVDSSCLI